MVKIEGLEFELRKLFEADEARVDVVLDNAGEIQIITLRTVFGTKKLSCSLRKLKLLAEIFGTEEIEVSHPGFFQNCLRIVIKARLTRVE